MKPVALIAALGVALSGCASIITGGDQSIAITTPPTTDATCTLSSKEGNWMVVSPGVVTVEKSKEDVLIRCTKPGWQDAAGTIPSDFQGWTLGNIILGGLIGVGVDAATGAINHYPNAYQVPMTPIAGYVPPPAVSAAYAYSPAVPSFGITGSTVSRASTIAVGMPDPHGVWIETVTPASVADQAGLRAGDIIQSFNDRRVTTFDELSGDISGTKPGNMMTFGVWRSDKPVTVTAVVPGRI